MNFAIDVFNYSLIAIMIGVGIAWIILIKSMLQSFSKTPYLEKFEKTYNEKPKVSIILPARNEEAFIEKCLRSLLEQDYENYEIIAINDSSNDSTGHIIEEYAAKNSKIIYVIADPKPDGWMGKNWACMQGYKKASGELFLFTDSDTVHASNVISLAVAHLLSEKIDALTAIPRMLCLDFWTKITLPMISTFLHTRFSALRVNDPQKKTGYFFGSFFIIKKSVYDKVGTHEGVKEEIIEDGALGKKVKESGYKIKMVRAENFIDAVWARDLSSLWHALKRLMVPLYIQHNLAAIGIFVAVLFLLFMPFPILVYGLIFLEESTSFYGIFISASAVSFLIYLGAFIEAKIGLGLKLWSALFGPLGSLVVVLGFLSGIITANSSSSVSWRGRSYSLKNRPQNSIKI